MAPKRVIIPRFPLLDEEALKASEKKKLSLSLTAEGAMAGGAGVSRRSLDSNYGM